MSWKSMILAGLGWVLIFVVSLVASMYLVLKWIPPHGQQFLLLFYLNFTFLLGVYKILELFDDRENTEAKAVASTVDAVEKGY